MYYVLTLYTFYCRLSRTQIVCFLNTIFNSFLASFCIQMGNTQFTFQRNGKMVKSQAQFYIPQTILYRNEPKLFHNNNDTIEFCCLQIFSPIFHRATKSFFYSKTIKVHTKNGRNDKIIKINKTIRQMCSGENSNIQLLTFSLSLFVSNIAGGIKSSRCVYGADTFSTILCVSLSLLSLQLFICQFFAAFSSIYFNCSSHGR